MRLRLRIRLSGHVECADDVGWVKQCMTMESRCLARGRVGG